MTANERRERLGILLQLAQIYLGISGRKLAQMLDRVPGRLIPESGIPRADQAASLARILDWPSGDVVSFILGEPAFDPPSASSRSFQELQRASFRAQVRGKHRYAIRLARQAWVVAESGDQRALACVREGTALDGLGHFASSLESLQRGLEEPVTSPALRNVLESNLANAYYTLWKLTEAIGIAQVLIDQFDANPPAGQWDRGTDAYVRYVRGSAYRRWMTLDRAQRPEIAAHARRDLTCARRAYLRLCEEFPDEEPVYGGIANTCQGGILEAEVELGVRDAESALAEIEQRLEQVVDVSKCKGGDWLESFGWTCIFGCNIALRHLTDERRLQRCMAVFTNKADEIADQIDNWPIRERVVTMESIKYERACIPQVLNREEVREHVGVYSRFPSRRPAIMKILLQATIVPDN